MLLNLFSLLPVLGPLTPSSDSEDVSSVLASRFSKRLNKAVYLGYNFPSASKEVLGQIQKRIVQEIKERPECF